MTRVGCHVRRAMCRVVCIGIATVSLAAQQPAGPFRLERSIATTGAGPQRLAVDVPLLAHAQRFKTVRPIERLGARASGGLSDVRIFDAAGREVPYLLVYPPRESEWVGGIVLPVADTRKTSGFEADLGAVRPVDMFAVEGLPAPFLKRLVLEGSGDREHWTVLAAEGTLFDLPQERLQQLSIPFVTGVYRYLRVTWNDTNSGRMPLPRSVRARVVPGDAIPHRPLIAAVGVQRRTSEPGRSRYRLRLPAAGLPVVAIALDVGPGHIFRTASVREARFEGSQAAPIELGRETLTRIERDGVTAASLRIPVSPPREAELDLVVDDGSNPPLDLRGVSIELAELPWIYFEAPGGPLTARYGGRSAAAPVYDLEAIRERVNLAAVPESRWGDPLVQATGTAAPAPPMPETGAAIDVQAFRYRRPIAAGPAGLVTLPLDIGALAHSHGPAGSFADVRIANLAGRQVPYLLERRDEPITVPLTLRQSSSNVAALRSEPGHNRSVYAVTLPYSRLPSPRLVFETSDRVFQRHVQVVVERPADRGHRDNWIDVVAAAVWQHASPEFVAPAMVLPLRSEGADLLVVVDEGDNRPLAITGARLLLPSWHVRFFSPPGLGEQPLRLLYGHGHMPPPRYDLALLAPQLMGAEAREIEAAAEESTAATSPPSLITPRAFWIGLTAAVLVLLGIVAKLVAGSSAAPSQPSPPAP